MKKTQECDQLLHLFTQLAVLRHSPPHDQHHALAKLMDLHDSTKKQVQREGSAQSRTDNLTHANPHDLAGGRGQDDPKRPDGGETHDKGQTRTGEGVKYLERQQSGAVCDGQSENVGSYMKVCFIHGAEHLRHESPQLFDLRERFSDFKNHAEYVFLEVKGKRFFEIDDTALLDQYIIMNCFVGLLLGYMLGLNQRQFNSLIEKLNNLNYKRVGNANSQTFLDILGKIVSYVKQKEFGKVEAIICEVSRSDHPSQFLACLVWSFKKILGEYLNELKMSKKNSYLSKYYITDHLFFDLGQVRPEDRSLYKTIRYCIEVFYLTIDAYCELVYIRRADIEYHYKNIFINKPKEAPSKKLLLYLVEIDEKLTIFTCHEQYTVPTGNLLLDSRVPIGERRTEPNRMAMSRPQSVDPRTNQVDGTKRQTLDERSKLVSELTVNIPAKSQTPYQQASNQPLSGLIKSEHPAYTDLFMAEPIHPQVSEPTELKGGYLTLNKTEKSTADTSDLNKEGSDTAANLQSRQAVNNQYPELTNTFKLTAQQQLADLTSANRTQTSKESSSNLGVGRKESAITQDTQLHGDKDRLPESETNARAAIAGKEPIFFNSEILLSDMQELLGLMEANSRKLGLIRHSAFKAGAGGGHTSRQASQNKYGDHHAAFTGVSSHLGRGRSIGRTDFTQPASNNRFGSRGAGKSQDINIGHRFGTSAGIHSGTGGANAGYSGGYSGANGIQSGLSSGYSGLNSFNTGAGQLSSHSTTNRYHNLTSMGHHHAGSGMPSFSGSMGAAGTLLHNFTNSKDIASGMGANSFAAQKSPNRFTNYDKTHSPSSHLSAGGQNMQLNSSKPPSEFKISAPYTPSQIGTYRLAGSNPLNLHHVPSYPLQSDSDANKDRSTNSPKREADGKNQILINELY